jgi:aromatic-L-amino-acid/L-tryptophan decarboxylase
MDSKNPTRAPEGAPVGFRGYQPEEFEAAMDTITRWASGYLGSLEDRNVSEEITPGDVISQLDSDPPSCGMGKGGWDDVVSDLEQIVEPGLVHWQSPRFFAYFPCSASMPGVMGELVSSVLNVNGMLWSTSPAATEIEMRMMDWCASLFGLPDVFRFDRPEAKGGGCIQGTASEAALAALVAARKGKVDLGRDRGSMTVYTSTQAHSSIVKAAMVAGLADGPDDFSRVRLIETNDDLTMNPEALLRAIQSDIQQGLTPCMVSTTQGTTSTGAFDPLKKIGLMLQDIQEDNRPWLHVDAAWAGAAAVCPEHRGFLNGLEHADSLCINPHKWLLTNFDCDLFWVRDRKALTDSMSITPAYLRNEQSDAGSVVDYRDWHVPLGRRMRAVKLWFVIRYFGIEGLREHIRSHIELSEVFERFVEREPRLEMVLERSLSLVCFRVAGDDDRTRKFIEEVNRRRRVMISHTIVPIGDGVNQEGVNESGDQGNQSDQDGERGEASKNRWVARVAIGSSSVSAIHIDQLIEELRIVLDQVLDQVIE